MKVFKCSFGPKYWMTVLALTPEDAALSYANDYSTMIDDAREFLLKHEIEKVHVLNETDAKDEGWFKITYSPVIIADIEKCEIPNWKSQTKKENKNG